VAAYGSVAHPVDLGPFSRIVGVHWKKKEQNITAVAFSVRVQFASFNDGSSLRYWSPHGWLNVPAVVPPPPLIWEQWIYVDGTDGGWTGALEAIQVTGLQPHGPPPPAGEPGWNGYDWGGRKDDATAAVWRNPSGSILLQHPRQPDDHFHSGPAAIDALDETLTPSEWVAYPAASVTATYLDHHFQYAGAVSVHRTMPGVDNILIGGPGDSERPASTVDFELWLLCTRVTS
jgi:hypothetical protein